MSDRDSNIAFVKTALLNRWEIVRLGKDGLISKHIREYPIKELNEVFIDFADDKLKEFPDGFTYTVKDRGFNIIVEPIEELEKEN